MAQRKRGEPVTQWLGVRVLLAAPILALLFGCSNSWHVYRFGPKAAEWEVRINSNPGLVDQACRAEGAQASLQVQIRGCTVFSKQLILSTDEPAVIIHELCHVIYFDPEHRVCQVLP